MIRLDPATNRASYTHENAERTWLVGLENSYFFNKVSFFQTYISQRLWYNETKLDTNVSSPYGGSGLNYSFSMNNTFFFNRSKTLQGTCSIYYASPRYDDGGMRYSHTFKANAGLSYTLLDGKLRIAADAYSLIWTELYININTPNYHMRVKNESNSPYCTLGLTYSFGASIEGKDERQSAKDLRSRM